MLDLCLSVTDTGIARGLSQHTCFLLTPRPDVAKMVVWAPQGGSVAQLDFGCLSMVSSSSWLIRPLPGSQVTLLFCKWHIHSGYQAGLPLSFEAACA